MSCSHRHHEAAGVRLHLQSTRLLQCSSVQDTSINRQPSTTTAECRCTIHTWSVIMFVRRWRSCTGCQWLIVSNTRLRFWCPWYMRIAVPCIWTNPFYQPVAIQHVNAAYHVHANSEQTKTLLVLSGTATKNVSILRFKQQTSKLATQCCMVAQR